MDLTKNAEFQQLSMRANACAKKYDDAASDVEEAIRVALIAKTAAMAVDDIIAMFMTNGNKQHVTHELCRLDELRKAGKEALVHAEQNVAKAQRVAIEADLELLYLAAAVTRLKIVETENLYDHEYGKGQASTWRLAHGYRKMSDVVVKPNSNN